MITGALHKKAGVKRRILPGGHVEIVHREAKGNRPMVIGGQRLAEAEAEVKAPVEIGAEKEDEVEVGIVIAPEGGAGSAEVTSESATIAGTETEREGEAGAQKDEEGTRIENNGAEVAIGTGRKGEAEIAMIHGEETAGKREEVERRSREKDRSRSR